MFSPLVFIHMLTVTADIKRAAKPTDTMMHLNKYRKSEKTETILITTTVIKSTAKPTEMMINPEGTGEIIKT